MCFFGNGYKGAPGPQSKADIAAGGYRPPGKTTSQAVNAANPHNDAATPQGQRSAVTSQQTADRNTIRRADSYGSRQAASKVVKKDTKTYNASAVQGGKNIMSALNTYNTNKNKKTILGS
jgi:hypothetical protein